MSYKDKFRDGFRDFPAESDDSIVSDLQGGFSMDVLPEHVQGAEFLLFGIRTLRSHL